MSQVVTVRFDQETVQRIEALREGAPQKLRSAIVREAVARGLLAVELEREVDRRLEVGDAAARRPEPDAA